MKTIQILELQKFDDKCNGSCTLYCALISGCPVANLDSHDLPLIKKIKNGDLDPVGKL